MEDTELTSQDELSGESGDNTSGGEGSEQEPRTYTEEEYRKGISDTLAERGRELASEHKIRADKAERQVTNLTAQITQMKAASEALQKQMDELEETKFGDNTDALSLHRGNRDLRAGRAKLAQDQIDLAAKTAELEAAEKEAKAYSSKKDADAIVAGFDGLEAQDLVTYTDGTKEEMEKFAKKWGKPKKGKAKAKEGDETEGAEEKGLRPDDGRTTGALTGDKLLEKANDDFNHGKITEKRYKEIVASVRK